MDVNKIAFFVKNEQRMVGKWRLILKKDQFLVFFMLPFGVDIV